DAGRVAAALVCDASKGVVTVWDGRTGCELFKQPCASPRAVALSRDGRLVAFGEGSTVRVYPVDGGPAVLESPLGLVHCIAFDPAGERVAAGHTGVVTVFGLDRGQALASCRS